jgi:hypothetical protein
MTASAPGSARPQLVVSGIEAARAGRARGMEVSALQHLDGGGQADGRGGDWNSFIFFSAGRQRVGGAGTALAATSEAAWACLTALGRAWQLSVGG